MMNQFEKIIQLGVACCLGLMLTACNQEVEKVRQNETDNSKVTEQKQQNKMKQQMKK